MKRSPRSRFASLPVGRIEEAMADDHSQASGDAGQPHRRGRLWSARPPWSRNCWKTASTPGRSGLRRRCEMAGYRKPNTSRPATGHKTYPYLLKDLARDAPQSGRRFRRVSRRWRNRYRAGRDIELSCISHRFCRQGCGTKASRRDRLRFGVAGSNFRHAIYASDGVFTLRRHGLIPLPSPFDRASRPHYRACATLAARQTKVRLVL